MAGLVQTKGLARRLCSTMWRLIAACRSPHGADTSLAGPKNAGDQVFYAYHGWVFGGRFAVTELIIRHLVWRGVSILRLNGVGGGDTLAVKLVVPAGCRADPEEALTTLRRAIQAGR
ncbi:hypothetical protein ABIC30_006420 [Methylobacterium sp. 1030]